MREAKIVSFSMPPALAEEIERIARKEHRTKSELFRDIFRLWKEQRQRQQQDDEINSLVAQTIADTQSEPAPSIGKNLKTSDHLACYGEQQADQLGIHEDDVPAFIRNARKQRRTAS